MKRVVSYFFFFLLICGSSGLAANSSHEVIASMPVAQLSGLHQLFPASAIEFTSSLLMEVNAAARDFSLNGWMLFFLSLFLYTSLILSVRLKKAWLSIAALSFFCLLSMSALTLNDPSPYVAVFLVLSFLLLFFDVAFFGGRGWMTWISLLPMSWAWWIWFCQGEIAHSTDLNAITILSEHRALLLLAAWIISLGLSQVDRKILKNIVFCRTAPTAPSSSLRGTACNGAQNLV